MWIKMHLGQNDNMRLLSYLFRCQMNTNISIIHFSHWVVSDSLWPHELQHTRPSCPSPNSRAYSNSCPSSRWCHPTISSCVIPFSSCLQFFPASGSFPMSQFWASGGQSIWVSASASVLPMNMQCWFPLGWTGWTSLQSKGLWVFSNTTVQKHQFFSMFKNKIPSRWSRRPRTAGLQQSLSLIPTTFPTSLCFNWANLLLSPVCSVLLPTTERDTWQKVAPSP